MKINDILTTLMLKYVFYIGQLYISCTARYIIQKSIQLAPNLPTLWAGFGRHIFLHPYCVSEYWSTSYINASLVQDRCFFQRYRDVRPDGPDSDMAHCAPTLGVPRPNRESALCSARPRITTMITPWLASDRTTLMWAGFYSRDHC